jgi:hypothetical protein
MQIVKGYNQTIRTCTSCLLKTFSSQGTPHNRVQSDNLAKYRTRGLLDVRLTLYQCATVHTVRPGESPSGVWNCYFPVIEKAKSEVVEAMGGLYIPESIMESVAVWKWHRKKPMFWVGTVQSNFTNGYEPCCTSFFVYMSSPIYHFNPMTKLVCLGLEQVKNLWQLYKYNFKGPVILIKILSPSSLSNESLEPFLW